MKIVCQSCSATYKIADDKVQGKKVFKIKCKKCGEDILVRGTDAQAPVEQPPPPAERPMEDESTRMMPAASEAGTEAIWHAVINGDQQGPFPVDQLRELLVQGSLDAETYVWRDGFEGWLPMHEVAELSFLLAPPPAAAPVYTPPPAAYAPQPSYAPAAMAVSVPAPAHEEHEGDLFGGSTVAMQSPVLPPTGADLFAAPAPAPAPAPMPMAAAQSVSQSSPAKARPSAKSLSGDLFAAEARAQEAARPLVPDAVPEAPAAAASAASGATGTRNENSVLFSLATLQQLSGGPANGNVSAPGNSSADSSGLIDINKLAGALNNANGGRRAAVDDILSVGTTGLGSPLSAPMLMPVALPPPVAAPLDLPPEKPQGANKTLLIGVIGSAAILAAGIAGAAYMFTRNRPVENTNTGANVAMNSPTPAAAPPGGALAAANAAPPTTATPAPAAAPAAGTPSAVAGATGTAAPGAAGTPTPGAAGTPTPGTAPAANAGGAAAGPAHEHPHEHVTHSAGGESESASAHALAPMHSSPSPAAAPRPAAHGSSGGSIDDLMNAVAGGGGAPAHAARPAPAASSGGGDLPATPSRQDVIAAMHAVTPSVRACGAGQSGMAMVTMIFAGSGRMTTATVGSPFSGTPVGTCVARAVRSAHLPSFSNATFNVTYPFSLQ